MGTPISFVGFLSLFALASTQEQYYGKYLGDFINQEHNVNGRVFAADFRTLVLVNFTYDGAGPDAFFWAGKKGISGPMPNTNGAIIPDENGNSQTKLKAYNQATLILRLPAELPLNQIQWLSVWCRRFSVNFGYILFTDAMTSNLPAPRNVGQFSQKAHGVRSGMVTVLDAKTIRIQNFHYDGTGPDAFFLVGSGSNPSASGVYYKVPDETGSLQTVRGYQGQTFELILPDPITVFDIDWLSLYCITYTENFGEVFFPDNAIRRSIIPPHLASLPNKQENCETLHPRMNVAWTVHERDIEITLTGHIENDEYMAFGISGATDRVLMANADVVVVSYVSGSPKAIDYYLNSYSLCSGGSGVCPDSTQGGRNDVFDVRGKKVNGITSITYKRPLNSGDSRDKMIYSNRQTYIAWAIGRLNNFGQVTKHHTVLQDDVAFFFGRSSVNNCKAVSPTAIPTMKPMYWRIAPLMGDSTADFTVRMGAAGGDRGYAGITGQPSWGIAYYINGRLIPELILERNRTYRFTIETGNEPSNSARNHPFYITDDPVGGYSHKTSEEKRAVKVFAGLTPSGMPDPKAVGRYCEYRPSTIDMPDKNSFEEYFDTLTLECQDGMSGFMTWTPDRNTPDMVYYQCYNHNYLGWKIHVVNSVAEFREQSGSSQITTGVEVLVITLISLFFFLY